MFGHNVPKKEDSKESCRSISPIIEIELISDYDLSNGQTSKKYRTKEVKQNALFPIWYQNTISSAEFCVSNIHYAFLRFSVIELDLLGSDSQLAQATFPISCLRKG